MDVALPSLILTFALAVCSVLAAAIPSVALALNPRAPLNRAVALNGVLLTVWAAGAGLLSLSSSQDQAWLFYRISTSASLLNPPSVIWFFLSFSNEPLRKKLFLSFPFWFLSVALIVGTWSTGLWYSGFVRTASGMTGVPTNPWAWWMFYVIVGVYVWAFFYFCSKAGYASARLSWLGRRFRTILIVAISVYVVTLVLESLFGWPDFSGMAYSLAGGMWLNQVFRYGFLGRRPPLPALDHVLSLDLPLALADGTGTIVRANPAFDRLFAPEGCAGKTLQTLLAPWPEVGLGLAQVFQNKKEQTWQEVRMGGQTVTLTLTPGVDEFGDVTGVTVFARVNDRWAETTLARNLSEKERQVALLIAQGRTTGDIARELFISPTTVRVHLFHICEKTGARNRDELIRLWSDV